jgi:hypothetical protein
MGQTRSQRIRKVLSFLLRSSDGLTPGQLSARKAEMGLAGFRSVTVLGYLKDLHAAGFIDLDVQTLVWRATPAGKVWLEKGGPE